MQFGRRRRRSVDLLLRRWLRWTLDAGRWPLPLGATRSGGAARAAQHCVRSPSVPATGCALPHRPAPLLGSRWGWGAGGTAAALGRACTSNGGRGHRTSPSFAYVHRPTTPVILSGWPANATSYGKAAGQTPHPPLLPPPHPAPPSWRVTDQPVHHGYLSVKPRAEYPRAPAGCAWHPTRLASRAGAPHLCTNLRILIPSAGPSLKRLCACPRRCLRTTTRGLLIHPGQHPRPLPPAHPRRPHKARLHSPLLAQAKRTGFRTVLLPEKGAP